ncbi:ATP-binding protein [Methylobacterium sp. CM6244]
MRCLTCFSGPTRTEKSSSSIAGTRSLTGQNRIEAVTKQGWWDHVHPDDTAALQDAFATGVRTAKQIECEIRLRHADGTFRWMRFFARPADTSEDKRRPHWFGGASDIDSQLVAERELRQLTDRVAEQSAELARAEARYESLFAISKIAFAEQDMADVARILDALKLEGVGDLASYMAANPEVLTRCVAAVKTISVNDACIKMLGFDDVETAVDRPVDRTAEDIEGVLLRQFEMIFYGWDAVEGRVVLIGSRGRRVPAFYSVIRLSDERQLSSLIDISSQERIEEMRRAVQEELARANRVATVGAFSASIAHELNQPIASISMDANTGLRLLHREKPNVQAAIRVLERMSATTQRVSAIVKHTHDRITSRSQETHSLDLVEVAKTTCDLLARDMQHAGVALRLDVAGDVPHVFGNLVDLQQVLINLINNAREAVTDVDDSRKFVTVSVKMVDCKVELSVEDAGIGIEPSDLERLFQPFFTTKEGGIGLGLQICRSTIQRLGGEMRAANREGGGAIFYVSLPLVSA